MVRRALAVATLSALLAACAVGPDYVKPGLPDVEVFARQDAANDAAIAQPEVQFWHAFGDPLLERLVDAALTHNHDLRMALANVERTGALLRGARYERLPTIAASAGASDTRGSASQMPGAAREHRDGDAYRAGFGASWELDFFGRIRRSVEARRAETFASAADMAAMQVAVVGELLQNYVQLRGWQEQLRIARENAQTQERTLQLLQLRLDAGMATSFDVDRGRTQLETTQSRIPAIESQIAVVTHRIAVLTGATPEALIAELETPADLPRLPLAIPVDAPGDLLRRRPDVAAAERRLAASTARIGIATADLFPRFTLGGLIGTQALHVGELFERDSETRLLSFGFDGAFLDVGRVRARIAAADAAAQGDLASWERTVLMALEETENALARLSRSSVEREHLQHAAEAGARGAGEARLRFEHGAIDVLDLLEAERARLAAEYAYAQSRVRHALAAVGLYQALAGGWPEYTPVVSAR